MTPEAQGERRDRRAMSNIGFVALWLACVGILICPPCAQMCAGLARFVLLAGVLGLYFAWPKAAGGRYKLGAFVAFVPVLALALALDLQAGMAVSRAYSLAAHGAILCLACAGLGATGTSNAWGARSLLFGLWFLMPLALGLWSHVAAENSFAPGRLLAWSPVGSFWQELPLQSEQAIGLAIPRNVALIAMASLNCWLARRPAGAPESPESGLGG
ncbi:MAG: hypothetical protein ACI87O_003257 [Planctomycetota bacterium]|jgi:hypothetical protein